MTQVQSFKVGDTVTLRKDLTRELAERLDEYGAGWQSEMVNAIGKAGTIQEANDRGNYRIDFPGVTDYWYSPHWLQPPVPGIYVAVSELRKIYDVACSGWKRKISKLVPDAFAENVFISEEQIREMQKAANRKQLTNGNPFIIHMSLATTSEMVQREIGFLRDRNTPILCNKETGEEMILTPGVHYLKFKLAK